MLSAAGVLVIFLVFWASYASASQEDEMRPGAKFTDDEILTLPRYCVARITNKLADRIVSKEEVEYWYATMGEPYHHIHHYCYALMLVRRGNAAKSIMDRNAHYRAAIANFNYSIRRSGDTFPLKPEFHLRKGMALRMLGNEAEASGEFRRAIALKPDYTPAYSALADLLVDIGEAGDALELLKTGLQYVPDSRILATKKAELEALESRPR
jgi:tetratricopeptide (TPR) repeat protein